MPKRSGLTVDEDEPAAQPDRDDLPYKDLETLRSSDGVIGIISQHRANGILTFTILREFEAQGRRKRTSFFPETMIDSFQRMFTIVQEKLVALRAKMAPIDRPR